MQRMFLTVLVASLAAGTAHAQRPHTVRQPARWVLNAHSVAAFGTSIGFDGGTGELKTSLGAGGGVQVGYMVTPRLTAYAGLDIAKQAIDVAGLGGDFGLTYLEAGARLSFPVRGSKALPYVGVWAGHRSLSTTVDDFDTGAQNDLSFSGMAGGVSGGLQYFVSPAISLDGALSVGVGKFGNVKVDGVRQPAPDAHNSTTTRVQFGANWYP